MATLQAAVEAVTGVTWLSAAPVVATPGAAWDDGGLHVVLSVPRTPRPGYRDVVIEAASITSALAAVPGYTTSTVSEDTWTFDGRQATVGVWVASSALTGDPTVPTATPGDADTSAASTAFVTAAIAAQAVTDSTTYATRARAYSPGRGLICFTFDDGYADINTVESIHNARNQRFTAGITSSFVGTANHVTEADVLRIHGNGHEIANHTVDHPHLAALTAAQRAAQYDTCQTYLTNLLGSAPTTFICPYGGADYTAAVKQETWLRFDRGLDVGGMSDLVGFRRSDIEGFVYRRLSLDSYSTNAPLIESLIRRAAVEPIIVTFYGHQLDSGSAPTTAQYTALAELAYSLGVECVTARDAFQRVISLPDPGFEEATLGSWNAIKSGDGVAENVMDTPADGMPGTRSMHLSATNPGFAYVAGVIPAKAGVTYTLSGKYRTDAGAGATDARIVVVQYTADHSSAGSNTQGNLAASATWTTFTLDFTPSATAILVEIRMQMVPQAGAAFHECWYDHLHVGEKRWGAFG